MMQQFGPGVKGGPCCQGSPTIPACAYIIRRLLGTLVSKRQPRLLAQGSLGFAADQTCSTVGTKVCDHPPPCAYPPLPCHSQLWLLALGFQLPCNTALDNRTKHAEAARPALGAEGGALRRWCQ